jgi:hypothetical protein
MTRLLRGRDSTRRSHSARIWNYWLGGKDNFAVDREAGDRVAAMLPIASFFGGLDLLEPGVVSCSRWRPDISPLGGQPPEVDEFCGVARIP